MGYGMMWLHNLRLEAEKGYQGIGTSLEVIIRSF